MEQFDVLDEEGNKTGQIKDRNLVHKDGDWHRSVHVWILNSRGQLLVQKRAPQKDSHPNMWDISCAGHVSAGESSIEAVVKEIKEELDVTANKEDFTFLFTLVNPKKKTTGVFINNEFRDVYIINKDLDLSKIKLQPEEVSEVKWISLEDLEKVIQTKDPNFIPHTEEYTRLIKYIRNLK